MSNKGFTGNLSFLSNFHKEPFFFPPVGRTVPTGEHAYQSLKTASQIERDLILAADGPRAAKRAGSRSTMRKDWPHGGRVWAMMQVVSAKFADPNMEALLYATDGPLVEYNYWHDNYWGVCTCPNCPGAGQNMLGELLMMRRSLRDFA